MDIQTVEDAFKIIAEKLGVEWLVYEIKHVLQFYLL